MLPKTTPEPTAEPAYTSDGTPPQPFRTLEDARTFLALYGGGAPAEDDLRAKLICTGDPDSPWQLPGVRRFGMIAFSTEEGEHI